ncbi:MAG: flagellin [Lachnospiraceae bacterium]|nr:flagellin [Lachnospiraceae bacterium]MBO6297555.1 flagellin [Lachnospiraceae bacterium]MBP3297335.1 flagellin [Lachnospiraceae bacterium]
MRINYNASAVISNKALNNSDSALSRSLQRLSSGLKINEAQDNPAGLAIAHRMDAQVQGLRVGKANSNDGISVIETADGALAEISSLMQRMSELTVQAATGTYTDDDREAIDREIQQLKEEVTRVSKDTEFNGQRILDGTFDLKGYMNNNNSKVEYYTGEVAVGKYNLNIQSILSAAGITEGTATGVKPISMQYQKADGSLEAVDDLTASVDMDNNLITIRKEYGGEYEIRISFDDANPPGATEMEITGIGAMKLQIGANEGQELAVQIPTISLKNMGLQNANVLTQEAAEKAIESTKQGLNYINKIRSKLGAYQNRLEHNTESLDVSDENLTAAYSRIMDVDMAEEMTAYTTNNVLVQAGVSMLSQANERPQAVLQLLQ